ncbi:uncharacterized protein N7503_000096 [Penicillium pulvis]|uniref:uncharacterized protein n=1 Tax=Penicillium pulvis TaxID=1562058 RepID=UPI002548C1ED|nr:uncharacterized protein N7503_000096 [Penicillium pulvis]KAJ5813346.1 hypothetical protein N7503_000096 [Penicillium pulvis]
MEQTDWFPMFLVEAGHVRARFHDDHERARNTIDECVGHHAVVFLPYDRHMARDATDATAGAGDESP